MTETNDNHAWLRAGAFAQVAIIKAKGKPRMAAKWDAAIDDFVSKFFEYAGLRQMPLVEVARHLAISQSTISQIKRGVARPGTTTLIKMSRWSGIELPNWERM